MNFGRLLIILAIVLISTVLHELAHGGVAYLLGDTTAKDEGRLSLNPVKHIDPVMSILIPVMLFMMGGPIFGGAKPVPVDARYFKNPKRGMAVTALAGPISNFVLAFVLVIFSKMIYLYMPYNTVWNGIFEFCLYMAAPLSIGLGLFNLLPIPPLDGSRIAFIFLPVKFYFGIMKYERYIQIAMFILLFAGAFDGILFKASTGLLNGILYLIQLIPIFRF